MKGKEKKKKSGKEFVEKIQQIGRDEILPQIMMFEEKLKLLDQM